ncbi:hypothetical protein GEMRC1_002599 [Eukaryota sp. GEM-RC1]
MSIDFGFCSQPACEAMINKTTDKYCKRHQLKDVKKSRAQLQSAQKNLETVKKVNKASRASLANPASSRDNSDPLLSSLGFKGIPSLGPGLLRKSEGKEIRETKQSKSDNHDLDLASTAQGGQKRRVADVARIIKQDRDSEASRDPLLLQSLL